MIYCIYLPHAHLPTYEAEYLVTTKWDLTFNSVKTVGPK